MRQQSRPFIVKKWMGIGASFILYYPPKPFSSHHSSPSTMDLYPTPYPGKHRPANSAQKDDNESKNLKGGPVVSRQKVVLGVSRSTNVLVKTTERPLLKPSNRISRQLKPSAVSNNKENSVAGTETSSNASTGNSRNLSDKVKAKPNKKHTVSFQVAELKTPSKNFQDGVRTPTSSTKHKGSVTPYHSAESCGKCRSDKLESSSYWLSQIKLAETVGKHFVSVAFFHLAIECNAEPQSNLRRELKQYIARHDWLSTEATWRAISLRYGLLNDEAKIESDDSTSNKASLGENGTSSPSKIATTFSKQEDLKPTTQQEIECETSLMGNKHSDHDSVDELSNVVAEEGPIKQYDVNSSETREVLQGNKFAGGDSGAQEKPKLESSENCKENAFDTEPIPHGSMKSSNWQIKGKVERTNASQEQKPVHQKNDKGMSYSSNDSPSERMKRTGDCNEKAKQTRAGAQRRQTDRQRK